MSVERCTILGGSFRFKAEAEAIAVDKKTKAAKTYKNGKPRKKGYVGALKKFRAEYEEEFLKWLEAK